MSESPEHVANQGIIIPVEKVVDEAVQHARALQAVDGYAVLAAIGKDSTLLRDGEPTALLSMVDAFDQDPAIRLASDPRALKREVLIRDQKRAQRRRTASRIYQLLVSAPLPLVYDDHGSYGHRDDDYDD